MTDAAHEVDPPASRRQPFALRLVEILLILMVFFAAGGEPPPHVNEAHYLTRLKHDWSPDWCAGDFFLESADAQPVFIWTFGWATRLWSLPATAWVGRLVAWTLLAWAWQRLSWRLVPRPLAAVLSAALFVTLNDVAHLAGEWVVGGVEAKCFAFVFVVLALREFLDQRWNRVCLLLGAAMAFHPLVGGWSAVACGGVWAFSKVKELQVAKCKVQIAIRLSSLRILPGLIGGGLLALVGIVPALALTWHESPEIVADANRIYVFERLPHHLALLSLTSEEATQRLLRHGALLLALWLLARALRRCPKSANHDSRSATRNQFSPSIDLRGLRCIVQFAWGAVLLAAIGLVIEIAFRHEPLVAARLLRYYWYRLTDFAGPLAVSFVAIALMAAGLQGRRKWATWGLAVSIAVAGWHLSDRALRRLANPVPPADRKMRDFAAWEDACQWIASHTEQDALFLTPRSNQSFKWRTGRAEVVTHKDIPQDARSIVEWFQRYRNVYYTNEEGDGIAEPAPSLGHLGTERVRQLAEHYGARYVLTDQRKPLWLPVVYPTQQNLNFEYVVYRIPDRAAPDRGDRDGE